MEVVALIAVPVIVVGVTVSILAVVIGLIADLD